MLENPDDVVFSNDEIDLDDTAWHPTKVSDWCMAKDEKLWNDRSNFSILRTLSRREIW